MDKSKVITNLLIYLGILAMGVVLGMTYQQAITQSTLMKVADNLEGVQIDIDLNETKLIEGITDFYTPYFEEMRNETKKENMHEDVEWAEWETDDALVATGEGDRR